jgi:WG containing repeat
MAKHVVNRRKSTRPRRKEKIRKVKRNSLRTDGRASLLTDKGYGYIDVSGGFVIKPAYSDARDFSDGLAAVVAPAATQPNKYRRTYIDKTGK